MCRKCVSWCWARLLGTVIIVILAAVPAAIAKPVVRTPTLYGVATPVGADTSANSLETAASRAADTGRTIGLSLIGLALAVAAVVLVFRRDFKEAIGLLAIGVIAVLLVSPLGVTVLQDTVSTLFGPG
jgi:hypothetical protein